MEKVHTFVKISQDFSFLGKKLTQYFSELYPKAIFISSYKEILVKKKTDRKDFCFYVNGDYPLLKLKPKKNTLVQEKKTTLENCISFTISFEQLKNLQEKDFQSIQYVKTLNIKEHEQEILQKLKFKFYKKLKKKGVHILDFSSTYIDHDTIFKGPCCIHPHVTIINSIFDHNCTIESFNVLNSIKLGKDSLIKSFCYLKNSSFKQKSILGPFCHTQDCHLGHDNILGNFVEIKRSKGKNHNKIKHHTYLGDSSLGSHNNIGAGTITCNFDGTEKHQTIIKNHTFIGANTNLIAPIVIEDYGKTGAGTTVSKKVKRKTLALTRASRLDKPL